MSDYIKRKDAYTIANDIAMMYATEDTRREYGVADSITQEILRLPSADVVEVVRCKDCEHFEAINNDDHGWCKMISDLPCGISVRYDDDYCSYGERRE